MNFINILDLHTRDSPKRMSNRWGFSGKKIFIEVVFYRSSGTTIKIYLLIWKVRKFCIPSLMQINKYNEYKLLLKT